MVCRLRPCLVPSRSSTGCGARCVGRCEGLGTCPLRLSCLHDCPVLGIARDLLVLLTAFLDIRTHIVQLRSASLCSHRQLSLRIQVVDGFVTPPKSCMRVCVTDDNAAVETAHEPTRHTRRTCRGRNPSPSCCPIASPCSRV